MRLFVAVTPPAEVLDSLDAAVAAVRPHNPELRWIPRKRWHLTLSFLGEVADATVPRYEERLLRAAARYDPLRLQMAGAGRFGRQILWAGIRGDVDVLQRLAASTSAAARRCGIGVEDRPYRPHLTLARARGPADLPLAVSALEAYGGPEWMATEVRLVQSELGPEPAYTVVLTAPLRRPAGGAP